MLNAKIRNISYRDPHPSDRYKKARPVQQTKPYFGGIEKYLDARPPLTSIPQVQVGSTHGENTFTSPGSNRIRPPGRLLAKFVSSRVK